MPTPRRPSLVRVSAPLRLASGLAILAIAAAGAAAGMALLIADPPHTLVGALAGISAALGAAATAALVVARTRFQRTIATPVDAVRASLYRIVMGDMELERVPTLAAIEIREIGDGIAELADIVRRERTHKQALVDAAQSRTATAFEAALQTELEKERSESDALTGLLNRRRLDADLDSACELAQRMDVDMALCMIDVDHFKHFNDTYGHQKGDEVLRTLAQVLMESLRKLDRAYRYGGEEFCVILRNCARDDAVAAIHRLRVRVVKRFEEVGMPMTASFGVAFLPGHGPEPADLIRHADRALYDAKEMGRDRVVVASLE